jgi:photosystem II stability/assembly factor-like uncharacterized protein
MLVRSSLCSILLAALSCLPAAAQFHGQPWLPFGPDGGDARRIRIDPRDHAHLYLGTANGWLYESHNKGQNWKRLARIGKRDDLVIDSIVVDEANPRRLIVGARVIDNSDGGIYLSNDAGATWSSQAEMRGQAVRAVAQSRSDPNILIAGSLRGVFRSTDDGNRWTQISPADSTEIHEIQSIAIDPADPSVIYAGTWHLPWKTKDGGEHWERMAGTPQHHIIDDSDVFSIIVDPDKPEIVYLSACSGIYKSTDEGALFDKIQGIPSAARRTLVLKQDPAHLDTVFAGTTEGLWRSDDAGKTWVRTTDAATIVNDVAIDLDDSRHVLIATDRGGVLSSDDGGETFLPSNNGFSARQIVAFKRDMNHPATLYVGVVNDKDWGGVFESDNGAISWIQRSDGLEGRDVFALGQAADGTMIAGTNHGIFRLDSITKEWDRVDGIAVPAIPPSRPRVPAARPAHTRGPVPHDRHGASARAARAAPRTLPGKAFDGSVYGIVTAGQTLLATTSSGLFLSADDGITWTAGPADSLDWRQLAAAKANVVAAGLHTLEFSSDAGQSWAPVKAPADLSQIAAVAVEPNGAIWVGGREGVWVSSDGGNAWTTPKNLFVNTVNNLFYDEGSKRLVVTTGGSNSIVYVVSLPDHKIEYADAGWNLRFARPVGDHLVAATLFDGMVVQPRILPSLMNSQSAAAVAATAAAKQE